MHHAQDQEAPQNPGATSSDSGDSSSPQPKPLNGVLNGGGSQKAPVRVNPLASPGFSPGYPNDEDTSSSSPPPSGDAFANDVDPATNDQLPAPLASGAGTPDNPSAGLPSKQFREQVQQRFAQYLDNLFSVQIYNATHSVEENIENYQTYTNRIVEDYRDLSCPNMTTIHEQLVTDLYYFQQIVNTTRIHYNQVKDIYRSECAT